MELCREHCAQVSAGDSSCSTTCCSSTADCTCSVSSSSTQSDGEISEKLIQFDNEIRSLDRELTKEYLLARKLVPDIVAIESDPLKHLRAEDGHIRKAATRAALYWKKRRYYFGEDRWLRPMTQTEGTGALSIEDIEVLRSGYIVIVTLHSGLQVAMIDPSRLGGKDPAEARERCIFYLCTNEIKGRSARYGLEVIFLLTPYGFASERHTEMIDVLYQAMPTKVRHLTILQSIQEGRKELLDFLAFRLEKTFEMFTSTPVTVVRVDSRQTVINALERRGIHWRYLPKQLGGDYDYLQLSEWVQTRLVVENAMGAALPPRNDIPASFRKLYSPTQSVTSLLWSNHLERKRCAKRKGRKSKHQSLGAQQQLEGKNTAQNIKKILSNALEATSDMSL
uniref:CRAL-TRIO domain-containing protein n=1 Tax=Amphora coffeiformis TaxID=265554 RepID=A0A7S3LC56_9STRA